MPATVLRPDAAVIDGTLVTQASILVENGWITAIGEDADRSAAPRERLAGTLLPGPIDLQVNGAAGHGVEEATPAALDAISVAVREGGATAFLPTLITAPMDELLARTAEVAEWLEGRPAAGAIPLGLHLEGPFLEVSGAHDPARFVDPTPERIGALLDAARGHLALVTLAPARHGSVEATRRLVAAGVCVAIGHAAGVDRFAACVDAGARLVTHLYNAMSPAHHRAPGVAGLALDDERLACSMIVDGVHVHPAMVRNAWRCLGRQRLVLITDSISAAGMPDGTYQLSGVQVRMERGVVRDGQGRLAGSALSLQHAARNFLEMVPTAGPVDLACVTAENPARLLGDDTRGVIAEGRRAEFALLRPTGELDALALA